MCAYVLRRKTIFNALKNDPIKYPINNRLQRSNGVVAFLVREWKLKKISDTEMKILQTNVSNKFLSTFKILYDKLPKNQKNYASFEKCHGKWLEGEFSVDFGENVVNVDGKF